MIEHRVAVAFSGGRDSTALLHATIAAASEQGVQVIALHVHHGLSPNADEWLAHGEAQCRRWARAGKPVAFVANRLVGRPIKGESVEAWARQVRYRTLRTMALAHGATLVLLAHHRRDQAETFLLQALRGAGVAGLSGMPQSVEREGVTWQRPWLDKPSAEIDAYVRRHRLSHIEDESNADPRFGRNRLRLAVWPTLTGAFEQAESSLARTAAWAQQADAVMQEVAALDLAQIADNDGLRLAEWFALSSGRRSNALRAWINREHGSAASANLIERLLGELDARRAASWPLGKMQLRLHRGVLQCETAQVVSNAPEMREKTLSIRRAGTQALTGWQGLMRAQRVQANGVALTLLAQMELRPRGGGEQFQAGPDRPPRSLKKQYQDAGVPAWERAGPLVYSAAGRLIFVPGLGLDARAIGVPGEPMFALKWVPRLDAS